MSNPTGELGENTRDSSRSLVIQLTVVFGEGRAGDSTLMEGMVTREVGRGAGEGAGSTLASLL